MTATNRTGPDKMRLLYLSGALRVSTRAQAVVGGARAHVLGVMKAFKDLHWQVSSFIAGDIVPLSWVTRSFDPGPTARPGKRMAADIIRLLGGFISGLLVAGKIGKSDLVYERLGSFQNLGARCKKKGVPWILETNALLFQEALLDRRTIYFHRLAKKREIEAYRNCDALVCVSEGLKRRIVAASAIDPQKVIVVPNGVDVDFFNPGVRSRERFFNAPTIGFVGTMYPWQGLDLLLSVLADLSKEGFDLKLALAGDGPEFKNLRQQAAALRLNADVRFSGRVSWHDIPAYMAGFDIGYSGQVDTQAGDWYGSPIKIYEIMAMGKPVIASAFEDARQAIVNGRTGYLFRPGDRSALKAALKTALAQRKNWPEMGALARNEVERSCSWTARVRSMIPRLECILEK